jgi:hypothetical protein
MHMTMQVYGFSVKREHQTITIVANDRDGNQMELAFWGGDVPDLAGMLLVADAEWQMEESQNEAQWEAELDQKVDDYYMSKGEKDHENRSRDS